MTSLAVDKTKKKVTLTLTDQSQLTGHIFLSIYSEIRDGKQTVSECLNSGKRFMPFETADGEVSFLNLQHIVWLASLLDDDDRSFTEQMDRRNVTVYLRDGKRLRGDIAMVMPIEKSRLSDWLNHTDRFLVMRDDKREVLINVEFVIRVA